jgi:hypothetical protein
MRAQRVVALSQCGDLPAGLMQTERPAARANTRRCPTDCPSPDTVQGTPSYESPCGGFTRRPGRRLTSDSPGR